MLRHCCALGCGKPAEFEIHDNAETRPDLASIIDSRIEPALNEVQTELCPEEMHRECSKDERCQRQEPDCQLDKLTVVRRLPKNWKFPQALPMVTEDDEKKIDRIVTGAFKKCRKLIMTVEEAE